MLLLMADGLRAEDYETGRSAYIMRDYARALEILQPLAESGDPEAQKIMGIMYDYGHGVTKDPQAALSWYLRAAEQGNPDVQYHVGVKYFHGEGAAQDYAAAAKWWELAANGGQADAQFYLGLMYYRGMVMAKDNAKAAQLFQRAAGQGHNNAQFMIGYMYTMGEGFEKNYKVAVEWFQKSADQGVARAQFNLGVFYENGFGVDKDMQLARKWYERASAQGLEEAINKVVELSRTAAPAAAPPPATAMEDTVSGPARTPEQGIRREDWVLSQRSDSYTLQIGSVTDEADIIRFIKDHHIETEAAYVEVVINGVTRYNAVYGVFPNYQAANDAIESLPAGIKNIKPWVRNFGILQQMLK
jgi:hypothetical protein